MKTEMKIVILDGYTENPGDLSWEGFANLGDLTVYDRTAPQDIIPRIGAANIVIVNKTPITRDTLAACPGIKYIGVLATGYNVVDVDAAREQGVIVTNIPTYGTAAVAQMAMALLLEVCHHVGSHSDAVHAGQWSQSPDFCFWNYPLIELAGKTFGAVGFGRIGQKTAEIAKAFGMTILAHDAVENESGKALADYVSLEELLAQSDIISLHCPLTPATEGLINKKTIAAMKDGAILINTSRGPLLTEDEVAAALHSGKLAAVAVDVVSTEPISADNPLLTAPNCLITPHIAWAPKESRARLMDIAVQNLKAYSQGAPINVVNK